MNSKKRSRNRGDDSYQYHVWAALGLWAVYLTKGTPYGAPSRVLCQRWAWTATSCIQPLSPFLHLCALLPSSLGARRATLILYKQSNILLKENLNRNDRSVNGKAEYCKEYSVLHILIYKLSATPTKIPREFIPLSLTKRFQWSSGKINMW